MSKYFTAPTSRTFQVSKVVEEASPPATGVSRGCGDLVHDSESGTSAADPWRPPRPVRHWLRWAVAVVAVVALAGFTVVYGRLVAKQGAIAAASPLLGKPAPAFSLPRLDGGVVGSRAFAGRVLVVNFWASWCVACREEAASLESFYRRWSPTGLQLVGVVYADSASDARAFDAQYQITYPNVTDPSDTTALDYGVTGVPETFVISPGGVVVAHLVGAVGPATLDSVLARLSGGGAPIESHGPGFRQAP